MSQEIFDRKTALEQMGGDEELMVELVELFLEDLPERLQEIEAALAAGDAEALSRAAHTLKGRGRWAILLPMLPTKQRLSWRPWPSRERRGLTWSKPSWALRSSS